MSKFVNICLALLIVFSLGITMSAIMDETETQNGEETSGEPSPTPGTPSPEPTTSPAEPDPTPTPSPVAIGGTVVVQRERTGELQVGELLTADTSGITPEGAEFDIQWNRGSEQIEGATEETYRLTNADLVMDGMITVTIIGKNNFTGQRSSAPLHGPSPTPRPATPSPSPQLSSDNNLGSLSVNNAEIYPSFSSATTAYSTTVAYGVTSLNVNAVANHERATVSVTGNNLSVGSNTVSIIVTAENGATKTYTINVLREEDDEYVPSGNSKLERLVPENGILSPPFNPDTKDYVLYLPYEINSFNVIAQAMDEMAKEVIYEEVDLEEGENIYTISVIAEDNTKTDYTISVWRMPEFGKSLPIPKTPAEEDEDRLKIRIIGVIRDGEGNPLRNISVKLDDGLKSAVTGSTGLFIFDDVELGYRTFSVTDNESGGENKSVSVILTEGSWTYREDNILYVTGDTGINFVLDDGFEIRSVSEIRERENPGASSGGVSTPIAVLIAILSLIAGGGAIYLAVWKGYL